MDKNITLTVVVLDSNNKPDEGAQVFVEQTKEAGTTNSVGEVNFNLSGYNKYDITASSGRAKVTVPYYVTSSSQARLVVSPTYVRSVEKKLHPSIFSSNFVAVSSIILALIVLFLVFFKIFKKIKRRQRRRARAERDNDNKRM